MLLATILALLMQKTGSSYQVRALIDPVSELLFVSEHLVKRQTSHSQTDLLKDIHCWY